MYISGSAVDDEVFNSLLSNDGFGGAKTIPICEAPLTFSSIEKLILIKNIGEFYIESETMSSQDLQRFKPQRPNGYVEFNREEVVI